MRQPRTDRLLLGPISEYLLSVGEEKLPRRFKKSGELTARCKACAYAIPDETYRYRSAVMLECGAFPNAHVDPPASWTEEAIRDYYYGTGAQYRDSATQAITNARYPQVIEMNRHGQCETFERISLREAVKRRFSRTAPAP
ncbi:MAG: hypothetical protein PHE27_03070 [Alphaproteobacteria bacterium]|nr:hypothetical protein [Alphaproteobacteria bacterium]